MSIKILIKNRAERPARPQFSLVGFVGCFVGPWSVASQPDKMLVPSRLSCTYVSCKEAPVVAFASRSGCQTFFCLAFVRLLQLLLSVCPPVLACLHEWVGGHLHKGFGSAEVS